MSTPTFPERRILDGFEAIENSLIKVLRHVPYCKEHEPVWSPVLADCIIHASHQLDSLWKVTARMSPCIAPNQKLNIKSYYKLFGNEGCGSSIYSRWVVFWGEIPLQLRPFASWEKELHQTPTWWRAYNNLKHDRWRNIKLATLQEAVNALAALFIAIIHCEYCRNAVAEAKWLSGMQTWESLSPAHSRNLQAHLAEDSRSTKDQFIAAESKLFSYPVGWWCEDIRCTDKWQGDCSPRFREWFDSFGS